MLKTLYLTNKNRKISKILTHANIVSSILYEWTRQSTKQGHKLREVKAR